MDGSILDAYYPAGAYGGPTSAESWPVWQCNDLTSLLNSGVLQYVKSTIGDWHISSCAGIRSRQEYQLVCYEGGFQGIAFLLLPLFSQEYTAEDQLDHPSFSHDCHQWRHLKSSISSVIGHLMAGGWCRMCGGRLLIPWCGSGGTPGTPGWISQRGRFSNLE